MLNHPKISIIEWMYLKWTISKENFQEFIKNNSFDKTLEKNPKIKEKLEKILNDNKEKDTKKYFKDYLKYLPTEIQESFIVKQLEENFLILWETSNLEDKKNSIFISLEKTLNNFLNKHKYFYKPNNYYDAIDYIRKVPWKNENINDFFWKKLNALAYVMQLAGINPWETEQNYEAWKQAKTIELKEQQIKQIEKKEIKNTNYEKIKKLIEKNNNLWQEKIAKQKSQLEQIKLAEEKEKSKDPNYQKEVLNDFIN
jgi:hypothetical protein